MATVKSFDGGEFDAYVALPAGGFGPGIVVLQEIFPRERVDPIEPV